MMRELPTDPPWMKAAWAEEGVKEITGSGSNPRIEEYHRSTTLDKQWIDDATAWCASFANWCIQTGTRALATPLQGTRSAMAKSFRNYGRPTRETRGAIAVFNRPPNPESGHVGFLVAWDVNSVTILGGNQSNAVTVERFSRSQLIALRWPNSYPLPDETHPIPAGALPETSTGARDAENPPPVSSTKQPIPRPQASPQQQPRQDSWGGLLVVLAIIGALIFFAGDKLKDLIEKIF